MEIRTSKLQCLFASQRVGNRSDFRSAMEIRNRNRKNRAISAHSSQKQGTAQIHLFTSKRQGESHHVGGSSNLTEKYRATRDVRSDNTPCRRYCQEHLFSRNPCDAQRHSKITVCSGHSTDINFLGASETTATFLMIKFAKLLHTIFLNSPLL